MDVVGHDHVGKRLRQAFRVYPMENVHHHLRGSGIIEVASTPVGDRGQDVGVADMGMAA